MQIKLMLISALVCYRDIWNYVCFWIGWIHWTRFLNYCWIFWNFFLKEFVLSKKNQPQYCLLSFEGNSVFEVEDELLFLFSFFKEGKFLITNNNECKSGYCHVTGSISKQSLIEKNRKNQNFFWIKR
jgi:hypothetical protein